MIEGNGISECNLPSLFDSAMLSKICSVMDCITNFRFCHVIWIKLIVCLIVCLMAYIFSNVFIL